MSKKIQSVQEVPKLKIGFFGYHLKLTFQTFFKISGFFANHLDNLESSRLIKKQTNYFLQTLKKSSHSNRFLNTNYIVFLESFQTVFSDFVQISGLFANLPDYLETARSIKNLIDILRKNKSYQSKGF